MRVLLALLLVLAAAGVARAQGVGVVGSETPAEKARPLPDPPPELAKLLEVYAKEPQPQGDVKRLFASTLYYLFARDLDSYVRCLHADFELEENGSVKKLPLADHVARVKKLWETTAKPTLGLGDVVELDKARAYTREQAKRWIGDWKKQPSELAKVMQEGDFLVIAPLKSGGKEQTDFYAEVYYIIRKQDGLWKVAIGE